MERNELKIVALRQRLRDMIAEYEEKIVEMRISFTLEIENLQNQINERDTQLAELLSGNLDEKINELAFEKTDD